ncbi:hypothetical protein ES705_45177 [subsurface metagenome]
MNRRCVNNLFGYCSGTPQCQQSTITLGPIDSPQAIVLNRYEVGACALNPLDCGYFITAQKECRGIQLIEE